MNLFHAVKLVCAKTLMHVPISGNITIAHNGMLMNEQTPGMENLLASQFAYDTEERAGSTMMVSTGMQVAGLQENSYQEESKAGGGTGLLESAGPMNMSELGLRQQNTSGA